MRLCDSIDTLSMAYLDVELATEERHELETHLTECASCRAHVDGEQADLALLRKALVAPPAPDLARARLARALDLEDREAERATRQRWTQWALPGSAIVAAAAAIVVFVAVRPPTNQVGSVAQDAVRQQTRALPLEVQGERTGEWLRQNFEPTIEPVRLAAPGSVIGARLLPGGINRHDAALMSYQIRVNGSPFVLSVLAVRDVRGDEMTDGAEVQVGDRTMHVIEFQGRTGVSYVADNHMGYIFMAPELSVDELIGVVNQNFGGLPR